MTAVVPVQYLADMAVLISDAATGKPALAVIIEPQLRDSDTKRYSWPVYLTTARRLNGCPAAVLVVLCPDPAEADKCRQTIRTGHPGFDLTPIVIDSSGAPGIDEAGSPFLTVFAASIHDQGIAEGEAKGKAEGKAEAVLRLLDARGLTPTDGQRQQVSSSTDPAQLDLWFDRAITASTASEVFAD